MMNDLDSSFSNVCLCEVDEKNNRICLSVKLKEIFYSDNVFCLSDDDNENERTKYFVCVCGGDFVLSSKESQERFN